MSRLAHLKRILESLTGDGQEIEGAAVLSEDGLIMASVLPASLDEMRVSAASAAAFGAAGTAAAQLERGAARELILRGERGYAVVSAAARGVVLVVLASSTAKLGGVLLDVRDAVGALDEVLG